MSKRVKFPNLKTVKVEIYERDLEMIKDLIDREKSSDNKHKLLTTRDVINAAIDLISSQY